MKIGILTYHKAHNYGAVLQAVALREILSQMGHQASFVDYWPEYHSSYYRVLSKYQICQRKGFKKKINYVLDRLKLRNVLSKRICAFNKDINQLIAPYCVQYSKFTSLDAVVYGSDQIWRKQSTGSFNPVYFANNILKAEKHIAYAASMGKNYDDYASKAFLSNHLKSFNSISVRESELMDLLSGVNVPSQVVLDPTLLLNQTEWDKLICPTDSQEPPYLLFYNLQTKAFNRNAVFSFAKRKGLKVIEINSSIRDKANPYSLVAPIKFVSLIRGAQFVITSSFHGLAFSIIYNKNFLASFDTKAGRAMTLLESLGLTDRLIPVGLTELPYYATLDFQEANNKLKELQKSSIDFLRGSLSNNAEPKLIKDRHILNLEDKCTGCFSCQNTCPKDAITLLEDKEGFYRPVIDANKCIDCGLCDKHCPQLVEKQYYEVKSAYYGWSKDDKIRKESSSGGLFHSIAENIIAKGGVVYGAAYNNETGIRLECYSSKQVPLVELQKSKYVQNYVGDAFRRIEEDLQSGVPVLYCGTPCQVDGLRSYLKRDFNNLLCVDFVCHGVPSMSLLRKDMYRYGLKKINDIVFRSKQKTWQYDYFVVHANGNRKKWQIEYQLSEFFQLFTKNISLRRSCYNCLYCNGKRAADLTLADFWGIKKYNPRLWDHRGISLVLANTEKGQSTIKEIQDSREVVIEELPMEYASYVYARDRKDPQNHYDIEKRNRFISDVYTCGYVPALKKHGYYISNTQKLKFRYNEIKKSIRKAIKK